MRHEQKGSVTIFLAWNMFFFLMFCLVLLEGMRIYFLRVRAAQALELSEFSVLSEYQYELFSGYGVFFLDLDYKQGQEQTGILEGRAEKYLSANAPELKTVQVSAENFQRATDGGGLPFFRQAVEKMKVKKGYGLFEKLLGKEEAFLQEDIDLEALLEFRKEEAGGLPEGEEESSDQLSSGFLPKVSFPSIRALSVAVFGEDQALSEKTIDLEKRLLKRRLERGTGEGKPVSGMDLQLFHSYLFEYCNHYGGKEQERWKEALEYQLEYVISGKSGDRENLEDIMWRIFLLRAGGNYLFYHQDREEAMAAEAKAAAIAGITGNQVLIGAVKEMILISRAIEQGIGETRQIFAGEKVPVYQDGIFQELKLGYEEYLYLFLNAVDSTEKIYRCMDIVELEVGLHSGYEDFRLDHCTDCFEISWTYDYEGLFQGAPQTGGRGYENTMIRKFGYEK